MLKKSITILAVLAIAVSPLLPSAQADDGSWHSVIAESSWDYDFYRVQQVAFDKNVSDLHELGDAVFVTQTSELCEYEDLCNQVDVTVFKDGSSRTISGVDNRITSPFWHLAQDDHFVYFIPSEGEDKWLTVFEYDSVLGTINELTELEREEKELKFMTLATDSNRVYTSIIREEPESHEVETMLSVNDFENGFERDDFTSTLTAPWQEIVDVRENVALVKFQFEGGFKQLWLVDQTNRQMDSIPKTWTEPHADLIAPHFRSDGTVSYFQNFRRYTYDPSVENAQPIEHGGAYLNWLEDPADVIQVSGDRVAWVDDTNMLYVSDVNGVSKFGIALNGLFALGNDNIYFQSVDGYMGYSFSTGTWVKRAFHVTDTYEDIVVGIDENQNIWYENTTSGYMLNMGYGSEPLLSDREHAYWKGVDGKVYQVSFSGLLDVQMPEVQAYSSYNSDKIYLISENKISHVPNPDVYFSYFDSYSQVKNVTSATLDVYKDLYQDAGQAGFAVGTRIKAKNNSRVYVVGTDGKLHWIISETVADSIYGSDWNQGIMEVNPEYLWRYAHGTNIASGKAMKTI